MESSFLPGAAAILIGDTDTMLSDGEDGLHDVFTVRSEDSHLTVSGKTVLLSIFSALKVEELEVQFSDDWSSDIAVCILLVKYGPPKLKPDQLILFVCLLNVGLLDLEITFFSAFTAWTDSSNDPGSSTNTKI